MKCPRIKAVKPVKTHMLEVEFTNNEKKQYDLTPLFAKNMFAPLKNLALFKTVRIEQGGYAVVWNSDIDISEYELWNNGHTIP